MKGVRRFWQLPVGAMLVFSIAFRLPNSLSVSGLAPLRATSQSRRPCSDRARAIRVGEMSTDPKQEELLQEQVKFRSVKMMSAPARQRYLEDGQTDPVLSVTFRFSVEANTTEGDRSLEEVIADFEHDATELLNETISANDPDNQYVQILKFQSNILESCLPSNGMDDCAVLESSVLFSVTAEIDVVKFDLAVLDEVKKYVEGYGKDDSDVSIKFIGPNHLTGQLIIELDGVPPTRMENETIEVFETILLQILSDYMSENVPELSIEAVTVLFQELQVSRQRHRLEEIKARRRSLDNTAKNRVHVYVDGKCDCDDLETDELFEDAVDAEGEKVKDKLKESEDEYFEELEKVDVIPREDPYIPDSKQSVAEKIPEKISKEEVPSWVFITFGVSSFTLVVGAFYILRKRFIQMGRIQDEDEKEEMIPSVSV